jgi:hypothetical protein
MKQRDRRAKMKGVRSSMIGASYMDEADLGKAAIQSL